MKVASVPRRHVYVRHLSWPGDGIERIAPPDATYHASTMLDPEWVRAHDVDCFHTHFGFGDVTPAAMQRWLDALADRGIGLVHTVHDLENPHRTDPARHRAQLDLLVPAARTVVTLTESAAAEIRRRWGRDAVVLPHPHVVDLRHVGRPRARSPRLRIGLHGKDLRPAYDVGGALRALLPYVAARPDVHLAVDVYHAAAARLSEALEPHAALVDRLRDRNQLTVRTSPFLPDRRFTAYVRSIDVAVLPYRAGTHSGWAEACVDVGTDVVVTDRTHVHRQHRSIRAVPWTDQGFDPDALAAALDDVWARRPPVCPMTRERREAERAALSAAHRRIYEEASR